MYGSRVVELGDEEILSRITCVDIYSYYIGKDFKMGELYVLPSARISLLRSLSSNIIVVNSFSKILALVTGDCFTFLTKMLG